MHHTGIDVEVSGTALGNLYEGFLLKWSPSGTSGWQRRCVAIACPCRI